MSDGDWRGKFAARGLAALPYVIPFAIFTALMALVWFQLSADYAAYGERAQERAENQATRAANRVRRECVDREGASFNQCVAEIVQAAQEAQRSEYDLSAQRQMSDWAWWVAIFTALTAGVAAVGLVFIRSTLEATREATNATREAYTAQERAWIRPDVTSSGGLEIGPNIIKMAVTIHAKNIGNSVAKEVRAWGSLHAGEIGVLSDETHIDRSKPTFLGKQQSFNIFPDDEMTISRTAHGLLRTQTAAAGKYDIYLIVRIEYRLIFDAPDAEPRITETIRQVSKSTGAAFLPNEEGSVLVGLSHVQIGNGQVT